MNSQELILGRIASAIDSDPGTILLRDSQWSNTGTLRTLDATTLELIAAVSYDFQSGYCHFAPANRVDAHNYLAALWYGQSVEGKAAWVKGSIPELVDTVVAALRGER